MSALAPAPVTTNSIGMKLALIPAGEYKMGSPESDLWAEAHEKPQHPVRIEQPFYLGVYEVTQAQYRAVTGDTPPSVVFFVNGEDLPMYFVSWKDALEFCNALSTKEGLKPYYRINDGLQIGGDGYRLPTEAEWEYACRAGSDSRYFFGDKSTELGDYAWTADNSENKPHPIGQKRPNAFGLYDMYGNVSEFCVDAFVEDAYAKPRSSGTLVSSLNIDRVNRGGGYASQLRDCRSATRARTDPNFRFSGNFPNTWGFRVARDFRRAASHEPRTGAAAVDGRAAVTAPIALANAPISKPPAPDAAAESPEGRLKARGLIRSGTLFVVPSEAEVLNTAQRIRPLIEQMACAYAEYAPVLQNESLLREAEEFRTLRSAQIDDANATMSRMPNGARANSAENQAYQAAQAFRDGLVRERENAAREIEILQGQQVPAERKEELAKAFASKRSDFLKAADELRPMVERTLGEYRRLQADASVNQVLAEFRKTTRSTAYLGPSKEFQKVVDMIKDAERASAPETVAPKGRRRTTKGAPAGSPTSGPARRK
jgi:formylglycine-generating enzyme required for sulfatase activity